jgi:hypothetical protein
MHIRPNNPSNHAPGSQGSHATPDEILDLTKRMLGGLSPYLCFGVAQHEAWLKATMIGATPDHDRCVRLATRHVGAVDPSTEAVAVVHAGMLLVAAFKAGIDPGDAGRIVAESIQTILPMVEIQADPPTDY